MKTLKTALMLAAACAISCRRGGKDWTVLSEKESQSLMMPCSRSFPAGLSGYWRLADSDVQRAETGFQAALNRSLKRVPKEERGFAPPVYYAQYAGFFRNGRKVVYVNAIGSWPKEPGNEDMVGGWRERAIRMCDGGIGSFGAVLDLDRDTVDSFEFSGTIGGPIPMDEPRGDEAAQPGVADGPGPRSRSEPGR
jgi:hypothetical protein